MPKLFLLLLPLLWTCSANTPDTPSSVFEAFQRSYRGHDFDIVKIDLTKTDLQFFLEDERGEKFRSFKKLKSHLEEKRKNLQFAMNGGMYLKDGSPQGLYIENGKTINAIDTIQKAYGNFYLQPNGVFFIKDKMAKVITAAQYLRNDPAPDFATQSGPMLVINNELHPVFVEGSDNLHKRNGVGIDPEGKVVFAISKKRNQPLRLRHAFQGKINLQKCALPRWFCFESLYPGLESKRVRWKFRSNHWN